MDGVWTVNLNQETFVLLLTLVIWWAWARPSMVRDYDGRRLANNTTARSIIIILYILSYVVLVVLFEMLPEVAQKVGRALTINASLPSLFEDKSPLLAAVLLGGMLQIPFLKEAERSLLVWLHSARHLQHDNQDLAKQLVAGSFDPNDEEQRLNLETAGKHGLHVLADRVDGIERFPTAKNWRKVASLLRLIRSWNAEDGRILTQSDMALLEEIETKHERKTSLAATIIKMMEHARRGGEASEAVAEIVRMLATSPQIDPDSVSKVADRLKGLIPDGADLAGQRPLKLTVDQLTANMAEIDGYFEYEYKTLLQQTAELAAKSVMLSGEAAAERLEALKAVGFAGFGRIDKINIDRISWMFLLVFGSGLLTLLVGAGTGAAIKPQMAEGIARFSFAMSIASLVGAVVGSRRRHARALQTPWGSYLLAAGVAGGMFVGVQACYVLFRSMFPVDGIEVQPLVRSLPWAFLPAAVTLAICRLSRVEGWYLPAGLNPMVAGIAERSIDGALVSLALLVGYYLAVYALLLTGMPLPPTLEVKFNDELRLLPIPIFGQLQVFGFIIGFAIVADVRRAAQASVVARLTRREAKKRERGAPVAAQGAPA